MTMQAFMKRAAAALALAMFASNAFALDRYEIAQMSCREVQAALEKDGTAILRYPSKSYFSLSLYDTYVSGQQACQQGEVARQVGVPTADAKYCPVHKCVESSIFVSR